MSRGRTGGAGGSGGSGGSGGITTIPFTTALSFVYAQADMGIHYVTGPLPFSANLTGAARLNSVVATLVADGVNAPTIAGLIAGDGDSGYYNAAGVPNTLTAWTDGLQTLYQWSQSASRAPIVVPATGLALSGPSSGTVGVASSVFTVTANGSLSGSVTVTPSSTGGGTFTPANLTLNAGTLTGTFTYTPASAGAKTISIANDASLANLNSITLTATAAGVTSHLRMNLNGNVVETGNASAWIYTGNSSTAWDSASITQQSLASDGLISVTTGGFAAGGSSIILALNTGSAFAQYFDPSVKFAFFGSSDPNAYSVLVNGAPVAQNGATIVPAPNDLMRMSRSGTTALAQVSKDGGSTWQTVHTLANLTGTLYGAAYFSGVGITAADPNGTGWA